MDDFKAKIHSWFSANKRNLPWRETNDPYKIWLSEIILQQTRIDQGMNYYLRFIEAFPTIFDLANATEDEILKLWQGLGYYSRARNLHSTARQIVMEYHGLFPENYHSLLKFKGIGEYTAAAITSISFGLPYPTIDGNVFRVLSRYFGINDPIDTGKGKEAFKKLAFDLINCSDPGMHNQSLMEFGALMCTPKKPNCHECPINDRCFAHLTNQEKEFPVKNNKTRQKNRYFNYIVLTDDKYVLMKKRVENDIWKNLYEFPLVETTRKTSIKSLFPLDQWKTLVDQLQPVTLKSHSEWKTHILSHQRIEYRFILISVHFEKKLSANLIQVDKKDIFNFAVPKLIEKFINNNNWI